MKPILYSETTENFDTMGLGVLEDCIKCEVEEERNGKFEAVLQYPKDGPLFKELKEGCFIKCKANDKQDLQIFRVYNSSKVLGGVQTFYCEHVSYRLNRIPVKKLEVENVTATEAMQYLKDNSLVENKFNFSADFESELSTKVGTPSSVRKMLGGITGSILDTWNGEYEWDNFNVILHKQRGDYKSLSITYGKNLLELNQTKSIGEVYTAVLPYATYLGENNEEVKVELEEGFIPYEDITAKEHSVLVKDFSELFEDNEEITEETLRSKCKSWMLDNKLYLPSLNLVINFAKLEQTEDFKDFLSLDSVNLCDWVIVRYPDFGIDERIEVIRVVYDSLLERYNEIELGDKKSTLNSSVSNVEASIGPNGGKLSKIEREYVEAIKNATELITGNSGGYVVLRPGTKPEEILVMDTADINTAKNVWRWNKAGLAHSSNGYKGPFDVAITQDGKIVADYILAGILKGITIEGNRIIGGSIEGSEISTEKDVNVGNNINLNVNDGTEVKTIRFSDQASITFLRVGGTNEISIRAYDPNGGQGYTKVSAMYSNTGKTRQGLEVFVRGNDGSSETYSMTADGAYFGGNLHVSGKKNRVVKTESFGNRLMNAIESANAVFEDFGSAETDKKGIAHIKFDKVFLETVNTKCEYQVFLQEYVGRTVKLVEKNEDGFMVFGNPNSRFDWRVCVKQRGYENTRLERVAERGVEDER